MAVIHKNKHKITFKVDFVLQNEIFCGFKMRLFGVWRYILYNLFENVIINFVIFHNSASVSILTYVSALYSVQEDVHTEEVFIMAAALGSALKTTIGLNPFVL